MGPSHSSMQGAMSEHFEEKVELFLNFTGQTDPRIASLFIKGNNADVPRAVDAFFENPDPTRYEAQLQYDESSWTLDRSGHQMQSNSLVPFQLDDSTESSQLRPLGAPSRPPSRLSAKGQMNRYGDEIAATQRSFDAQETGIVIEGQEYVPDPDVADRARRDGEPAFMKPLPYPDFLPSLVAILGTIPGFRELLFNNHPLLNDYGFDKHWFQGESVEISRILGEDDTNAKDDAEFLFEMQRLVAFLQHTKRAYGSVLPLSRCKQMLDLTRHTWHGEPPFVDFLLSWENLAKSETSRIRTVSLFSSKISNPSLPSWDDTLASYFDIRAADFSDRNCFTLYEAMDSLFWSKEWYKSMSTDSFIESIAPIIVIRIFPANQSTTKMEVPLIWFADRYLSTSSQLIATMKKRVAENFIHVDGLRQKKAKIENLSHRTSISFRDASAVVSEAYAYLESRNRGILDDQGSKDMIVDASKSISSAEEELDGVLQQLNAVASHLNSRIESLNAEEKDAQNKITQLESVLKRPTDDGDPQPQHRYSLRGVAKLDSAHAQTTFIPHIASEAVDTSDRTVKSSTDWWKIIYDTTGSTATITRKIVTEAECLEATGELSGQTLLVYASDEMLISNGTSELPEALQVFVDKDNTAFRDEIESGQAT